MALETFAFINALNASNPTSTDGIVQGDDHIRGIKATLLATFPNLTAAVTATAAQVNQLASGVIAFATGTVSAPSFNFLAETTLGFYRSAAGIISIAGGKLTGDGAVPTGAVCDFFSTAIPAGWYRLNGQAIPRTGATAGLFTIFGVAFGAGDGVNTFNLPNLEQSGGLFRRTSGTPGTVQTDAIKSFTAPISGTAADHTHPIVISDTRQFAVNLRSYQIPGGAGANQTVSDLTAAPNTQAPTVLGGAISGSSTGSGTLALSGNASYTGASETRPANISVVTAIKA
jgi:microcystin-dependent protein